MRCLARLLKGIQWVETRLNGSCNEIYEHGENPYGTTAAPDCFPIQTTVGRTEFVLLPQNDTFWHRPDTSASSLRNKACASYGTMAATCVSDMHTAAIA